MKRAEQLVCGTVVAVLPHAVYRVAPKTGPAILAHLSDEARVRLVHIRPGQQVRVAVSAYDGGRGRIVGPAEQGEPS